MAEDTNRWTPNGQLREVADHHRPGRKQPGSQLRLLAGQLVQGVAHRGGRLVTIGGNTLADRAALQADEPSVDARSVGVDPDDIAAVAGRPEPVAGVVLALVGHPGHVADRTFDAEPPSNAPPTWWRPALRAADPGSVWTGVQSPKCSITADGQEAFSHVRDAAG